MGLTWDSARAIYRVKLQLLQQYGRLVESIATHVAWRLAFQYSVSSRTIRDVWNRKTWVSATYTLWCEEDCDMFVYEAAALVAGDTEAQQQLAADPFCFDWVPPMTPMQ